MEFDCIYRFSNPNRTKVFDTFTKYFLVFIHMYAEQATQQYNKERDVY